MTDLECSAQVQQKPVGVGQEKEGEEEEEEEVKGDNGLMKSSIQIPIRQRDTKHDSAATEIWQSDHILAHK